MSTNNSKPREITQEDAPLEVTFDEQACNYIVGMVAAHQSLLESLASKIAPGELVACLALMQASLDVQLEGSEETFDATRAFFQTVYPALLKNNAKKHPDESMKPYLLIVPMPYFQN